MKAFLLAAGLGTRLRPLTDKVPKCLLPIGSKSLLQIWLEHLARNGVNDVLVNTHHHATQVEAFMEEGTKTRRLEVERKSGSEIENIGRLVNETSTKWPDIELFYEETLLGSGGTVYQRRDFVDGEESFWVIYGDNLSTVNLKDMYEIHTSHHALATIGLFEVNNPQECGIVTLDDTGRVVGFEEKPANPKGNLANAGIYVLSGRVFDEARWDFSLPMDFGFHILPQLVGRMQGHRIRGYHLDIGTPENYRRAQRDLSEKIRNREAEKFRSQSPKFRGRHPAPIVQ